MKIKKGDTVKIINGKDRGKKGKVTQVLVSHGKIVVENINTMIKNVRPKKSGEKGEKVEYSSPLDVSNVMIICPKCSKAVKIGHKALEKEKIRICKKCKGQI